MEEASKILTLFKTKLDEAQYYCECLYDQVIHYQREVAAKDAEIDSLRNALKMFANWFCDPEGKCKGCRVEGKCKGEIVRKVLGRRPNHEHTRHVAV